MEELYKLLQESLNERLYQITAGGPRKKDGAVRLKLRPVMIKDELCFQMECYRGNQVFHRNVSAAEAMEEMGKAMEDSFRQLDVETMDFQAVALVSKKGKITIKKKKKMCIRDRHEKFSGLINRTQGNISAYSSQIASAEAEVEALEAQIEEQNKNISALQKQLAEEIAKSRLAANSSWRDISEVSFTEDDRYLLANLIYCEAGGEPYDGQVAVGAVVINRVLSSVYPSTLSGVIYQNRQFEPVSTGRLALALAENRATASCYRAADEAMSGVTNVGNCVYFRTPIPGLEGINIGGHVFY